MSAVKCDCWEVKITMSQLHNIATPQSPHSQGVQHVTSEKQSPSPIDFLGSLKEAVAIEQRLSKAGTSKALRDVLTRCCGEYNRMVTKRSHRVDTATKSLILNLFLGTQKTSYCRIC